MSSPKHIVYLTVITPRNKKDVIIDLLLQHEAQIIDTSYARGSVTAGSLPSAFGLTEEKNRVISSCLLSQEKADKLIELLNREQGFTEPNTGIAYTVPVETLFY